jgi:hypothetical protein
MRERERERERDTERARENTHNGFSREEDEGGWLGFGLGSIGLLDFQLKSF